MSTSNKYNPGEFGYWWTVTMERKDIECLDYEDEIDASFESLTSLRGAPRIVTGNFWCNNNRLTSLEHCPESVEGDFWCSNNQLTSLKHCPKNVTGVFWCNDNRLTSLEHGPESVAGNFYCNDNELTNLVHAPHEIKGSFECENNPMEDPIAEIISNNIVAKDYLIDKNSRITFEELKTEKLRRANIRRQLGPFAITVPGSKI